MVFWHKSAFLFSFSELDQPYSSLEKKFRAASISTVLKCNISFVPIYPVTIEKLYLRPHFALLPFSCLYFSKENSIFLTSRKLHRPWLCIYIHFWLYKIVRMTTFNSQMKRHSFQIHWKLATILELDGQKFGSKSSLCNLVLRTRG